jgi:hypothetical protein
MIRSLKYAEPEAWIFGVQPLKLHVSAAVETPRGYTAMLINFTLTDKFSQNTTLLSQVNYHLQNSWFFWLSKNTSQFQSLLRGSVSLFRRSMKERCAVRQLNIKVITSSWTVGIFFAFVAGMFAHVPLRKTPFFVTTIHKTSE